MSILPSRTFLAAGVVASSLLAAPARASFQSTPMSLKAEAMGGAFVAMSDDATSVFINPAGLSILEFPEVALMYSKPLYGVEGLDLAQGYGAMGAPVGSRLAVGAGATMFRAAGILSEYQTVAGASLLATPKMSLGASASYLYHSYEIGKDPAYSGQPIFSDGISKGALGVNLGFLAMITSKLQLGASMRNVNQPDVGIKERDPVPREFRCGVMYRFARANVQAEIEQRDSGIAESAQQNSWKIGTELPVKFFSLRAGVNNNAVTGGFGLQMGALGLDYALVLLRSVEARNYGSHMMALTYRLGTSDVSARLKQADRSEFYSNFGTLFVR